MPHKDIPNLLGRVLSGTKYGVKQTRGKFGLGAKMALIWSKMSTGLPIEILSARTGQSFKSYYKLDIDIHKCAAPNGPGPFRTLYRHCGSACICVYQQGKLGKIPPLAKQTSPATPRCECGADVSVCDGLIHCPPGMSRMCMLRP